MEGTGVKEEKQRRKGNRESDLYDIPVPATSSHHRANLEQGKHISSRVQDVGVSAVPRRVREEKAVTQNEPWISKELGQVIKRSRDY